MRTTLFVKSVAATLRFGQQVCGLALVMAAYSGVAWAGGGGFDTVPEIDPGSMQAALMLLGGGVLLVADRFRRRSR